MRGACAIFGYEHDLNFSARWRSRRPRHLRQDSAAQCLQKQAVAALKLKISAKAADKKLQRAEIRAKFKKREIKFKKHKIKFKKREAKFEILKAQS